MDESDQVIDMQKYAKQKWQKRIKIINIKYYGYTAYFNSYTFGNQNFGFCLVN